MPNRLLNGWPGFISQGLRCSFSHQHGCWPIKNDSDAVLVPCTMGTESSLPGIKLATDMYLQSITEVTVETHCLPTGRKAKFNLDVEYITDSLQAVTCDLYVKVKPSL